jgi:hypothetical protein
MLVHRNHGKGAPCPAGACQKMQDHRETRGQHQPARPYVERLEVDVERHLQHQPWRRVEPDSDTDRLADERQRRNRDRQPQQHERGGLPAPPPHHDAIAQQPTNQARDKGRPPDVELGLLKEMDEREQNDHINELVQFLPAPPAEPAHHAIGRGDRERGQAEKTDEADGEIEPQHDLGRDLADVEFLMRNIEQDVGNRIAEGADADHAAHVHERTIPRNPPQRRDRERDDDKHQRPVTRAVGQIVERASVKLL